MLLKPVLSCLRSKSPERRDVTGLPKLSFRESFSSRASDATSIHDCFIHRRSTQMFSRRNELTSMWFFSISYYSSECFRLAAGRLLLLLASVTSPLGNTSGAEPHGDLEHNRVLYPTYMYNI